MCASNFNYGSNFKATGPRALIFHLYLVERAFEYTAIYDFDLLLMYIKLKNLDRAVQRSW